MAPCSDFLDSCEIPESHRSISNRLYLVLVNTSLNLIPRESLALVI